MPTNVVPLYELPPAYAHIGPDEGDGPTVLDKYELQTESGVVVPIKLRGKILWHVELVPDRPLAPNTKYRVRAKWKGEQQVPDYTDELTFTTGAGPRTGAIAAPIAALTNFQWKQDPFSSCSPPPERACIALQDDDATVEYMMISRSGFLQDYNPYVARGSYFMTDLNPATQTSDFACVRLRTRAIDATYSEPVTLCGADAPLVHVEGPEIKGANCTKGGVEVERAAASGEPGMAGRAAPPIDAGVEDDAGVKPPNEPRAPQAPKMPPAPLPPAAGSSVSSRGKSEPWPGEPGAAGSPGGFPAPASNAAADTPRRVKSCSVSAAHSGGSPIAALGVLGAILVLRRRRRVAR
ncbi:MAG TPA: MYXO-CTERM sorting domain-containing protein [Polyangiales bacterium]|nr:MYXO-CTERM sorting domain-containing protein [Polyangiales bacterium]